MTVKEKEASSFLSFRGIRACVPPVPPGRLYTMGILLYSFFYPVCFAFWREQLKGVLSCSNKGMHHPPSPNNVSPSLGCEKCFHERGH